MGAFGNRVRGEPVARNSRAAQLAALAVASLIDEARLSPKPGLVDSRGSGAHNDLDLPLMERSALSLEPAFAAMAQAGASFGMPTIELRETLGRLGREAEATMLAATGGVNTHRGAIWALGLLLAAASIDGAGSSAARTAAIAGAIARHADREAPEFTGHKGEQACRAFKVAGARGQARAGFPHVVGLGLPELQRSRDRGDGETSARLNALLAIISELDDTCVLSRGGRAALTRVQHAAAAVLGDGGAATLAGRRSLRRFVADALELNLSPGGAADLLAATLFLDRIGNVFDASLSHRSS
ncbi:MAG: triphosphoribosyl-dephospho-CoA synthase [Pseudomonadota bacterium]|nr:triphosphoribosyl-dephospho-CoA synthase [Pseudomonadota bacterium]